MAGVVAGGAGVGWVVEVEAVVKDEGALGEGGLGGAELHVAVDGNGVAGEDLAAEALGEGERERGLARGGCAEDDDQRTHCELT